MKKLLFFLISVLLFCNGIYAQKIWQKADGGYIKASDVVSRMSVPSQYQLFLLDIAALKKELVNAPLRGKGKSSVIVQFPDGNGVMKNFRIYEAPVVQEGLSKKYPDMKSYIGQGVDNPSEITRFSLTVFGLHNMMFTEEGTSYTDPYTKDKQFYIVYNRTDLSAPRTFKCGVTEAGPKKKNKQTELTTFSTTASDGVLRKYRLAMACTIEYAAFHIEAANLQNGTEAQQKEAVLAAMSVTVTRINSVYEKELAITLELVDNNDSLIFIDDDEFDNENENFILLSQSQQVIDNIIGFDNYDIGHTVSTGGGGVAQLYSPCSEYKAMGITGLYAPVGDPYDIDFVAHEMGHQFGANHTFNNSCDDNRNSDTAFETGSGSTIMAYAGVCFPSVQNNSDAYFHISSIVEITEFIKDWGNCSQNTATGNSAPVADAGLDYTIPNGTPFILKGSATDANGDALTYSWEQGDIEVSVQPPVATSTEGPNFRSLLPKTTPERYLPSLTSVLANDLAPTWEVIANVARTYNFAFTVRDNNIEGGQVAYDDMQVTVSGTAGPFLVTSPNTNVSWQAGSNQTVTWDVAGTTANNVNTAFVDILMSNDGGYTYPVVLASKVPNDGSELITVPVGNGSDKRIMVRANGNLFYDISNTNFTVTSAASTFAVTVNGEQQKTICNGGEVEYDFTYEALGGFTGETTFTITGNPEGSVAVFAPETILANGVVALTLTLPETVTAGLYPIIVTAASGDVVKTVNIYLDVLTTNFGEIILSSPADGTENILSSVNLQWQAAENAIAYQVEVATDENFEDIVVNETTTLPAFSTSLENETTYYWRVSPANISCAGTASVAFSFTTGDTVCTDLLSANVPVVISNSEAVTINSTLAIVATDPIEKLTIQLKINHSYVGDLTAILRSPSGTEVVLFAGACDDLNNVDAIFDDNGTVMVCGNTPAISGTVLPVEALSVFNGQSPQGTWTLRIADGFEQDGGQLVSWGLTICSTEEEIVGLKNNAIDNLSVYPNPNKGDFTVKLTSVTGNDIKVTVFDIGGRQLFASSFANTGAIEQPISLRNAQAGIYLVSIQDGDKKVTKKIVIQ